MSGLEKSWTVTSNPVGGRGRKRGREGGGEEDVGGNHEEEGEEEEGKEPRGKMKIKGE